MNERGVSILSHAFFLVCGILIGFIVHPMVIEKVSKTVEPTENTNDIQEEESGSPTDEISGNRRKVLCPRCGGGGDVERICKTCDGSGYISDEPCFVCNGSLREETLCDVCDGSGKVDANLVR